MTNNWPNSKLTPIHNAFKVIANYLKSIAKNDFTIGDILSFPDMLKMWKIVKTFLMTFLMTQDHSLKTHLFKETIKYLFNWHLHVCKRRSPCLLLSPFLINSMLTAHTYAERKIWIMNYSDFSKFSYPLNFSPASTPPFTPYIHFIDIELKSLEKVNISQDNQSLKSFTKPDIWFWENQVYSFYFYLKQFESRSKILTKAQQYHST